MYLLFYQILQCQTSFFYNLHHVKFAKLFVNFCFLFTSSVSSCQQQFINILFKNHNQLSLEFDIFYLIPCCSYILQLMAYPNL